MARVGVDVGGTNTDLVLESGRGIHVHKVASTPHDQSEGVLRGLEELCEIAGVRRDDVELIVHGTTVATNITIEHDGAEVGMLTTRNFRDILHIGRHKRPHNFSLHFEVPWQNRPLVKRRNRIPITERILPPDGRVETPLDENEGARRGGGVQAPRHRVGGDRIPVLVRQRRPRAPGQGHRGTRDARRLRLLLLGGRQRHPRVRTLLDRGDECVHRPADLDLPRQSPGQARRQRIPGEPAPDPVERRDLHGGGVLEARGQHPHVGSGRRGHRGALGGAAVREPEPHHGGHRGHLGRHQHHPRRADQDHEPARLLRGRPSHPGPDDRSGHHRRRGRIDRPHRLRRGLPRRATLGRSGPGARLLRQGGGGADGDGCPGRAGPARRGQAARRGPPVDPALAERAIEAKIAKRLDLRSRRRRSASSG